MFDEANALLDPQRDALLGELLQRYRGRTTMILVSHRPTIINLAHRKFILANGTLTPQQTPPPPDAGRAPNTGPVK